MGILTRIMDSVVYWKESSDGVLEGQNCHRLRNINFDTLNSFCFHISGVVTVQSGSFILFQICEARLGQNGPGCPIVDGHYCILLSKTTPVPQNLGPSMCVNEYNYNYDFGLD